MSLESSSSLPRGRMVVVRDGPGVAELARTLRRAVEPQAIAVDEVRDIYEAIATVGATESSRVATVAIPLTAARDELTAVRSAVRGVDPSVRVILLAPRGSETTGTDFDHILFLPATAQDLLEAFDPPLAQGPGRVPVQPAAGSADMNVDTDAPPPPHVTSIEDTTLPASARSEAPRATSGEPETARASDPDAERHDMVDRVIDEALQAFAARRGRREAPQSPQATSGPERPSATGGSAATAPGTAPAQPLTSHSLGDIDLVDAVLDGGDRLVALATELLRRDLGASDIRIIASHLCDLPGDAGSVGSCPERGVPIVHRGETLGVLASDQVPVDRLEPWAEWLGHWLTLERAHAELRILAWTDELTGAGNRRAFERVLDDAIAAARPERRAVSLMYFDIDNFKSYNDRFGHEAGDEVLRETVELLRSVIRRGDHVFRVGGDEFVVIFADRRGARPAGAAAAIPAGGASTAPAGGALESIETITTRFRECIKSMRFPQLGLDAPGSISISAGVATFPWDGHDAHVLLAHADQLALQSKRSGKNAITFGPGAKNHCCDA